MLEELSIGGFLFSPFAIFIPIAIVLWYLTRLVLYKIGLYKHIWRVAWFEVALFVCYLALVVYLLGN